MIQTNSILRLTNILDQLASINHSRNQFSFAYIQSSTMKYALAQTVLLSFATLSLAQYGDYSSPVYRRSALADAYAEALAEASFDYDDYLDLYARFAEPPPPSGAGAPPAPGGGQGGGQGGGAGGQGGGAGGAGGAGGQPQAKQGGAKQSDAKSGQQSSNPYMPTITGGTPIKDTLKCNAQGVCNGEIVMPGKRRRSVTFRI